MEPAGLKTRHRAPPAGNAQRHHRPARCQRCKAPARAVRWPLRSDGSQRARPAGRAADQQDEHLPLVLRRFIWGFPHQYQARAPAGTTIAREIPGIGAWTLTRTATGWSLDEGQADASAVGLQISGEAAGRLLTGARYDARQVQLSGDPALAEPLLRVPGIIV